jgi:hypothetical protein
MKLKKKPVLFCVVFSLSFCLMALDWGFRTAEDTTVLEREMKVAPIHSESVYIHRDGELLAEADQLKQSAKGNGPAFSLYNPLAGISQKEPRGTIMQTQTVIQPALPAVVAAPVVPRTVPLYAAPKAEYRPSVVQPLAESVPYGANEEIVRITEPPVRAESKREPFLPTPEAVPPLSLYSTATSPAASPPSLRGTIRAEKPQDVSEEDFDTIEFGVTVVEDMSPYEAYRPKDYGKNYSRLSLRPEEDEFQSTSGTIQAEPRRRSESDASTFSLMPEDVIGNGEMLGKQPDKPVAMTGQGANRLGTVMKPTFNR